MDFTKFVWMLEHHALFFARSDKLGDPFEGSFSRGNEKMRCDIYRNSEIPASVLEETYQLSRWIRKWTMLSCWHMNRYESAGMWKLYGKNNEAIAVKSSYQQLSACLDEECFVGVVQYIDYDSAWLPEGNTLYPYVHKRLSYSHEQELRAVIQKLPMKDGKVDRHQEPAWGGTCKAIDLDQLISEIYVAPMSPRWYLQLVEQVVARYGKRIRVVQSSLDKEPFF